MEREAQQAWEIQKAFLPKEFPVVLNLQIDGSCQPARVVAGDYYDAFLVGEGKLAVVIADVVGKGLPAAFLMSNLQATVRHSAGDTRSPSSVCQDVNRLMARNVQLGKFVTFFYALFDIETRRFFCSNAGHNPPVLLRKDGTVVRFEEGGLPIGLFPDSTYTQQELVLESGDRLVLFTDGVTEARNAEDEEFGEDRLIALVREHVDAKTLRRVVVEAVETFSGGAMQDDVTVLALSLHS